MWPTHGGRHEPVILNAYRYGAWCECKCGWRSRAYTTPTGACCAFGQHLLDYR